MAPPYEHTPLTSPSCIRVIILKPARSREAPIECTLEEVDLENITPSSEFEALSYVWGSPDETHPIQCHGKELLVTPNCHDALIRLRRRWKRRRIFIDAICIDQRQDRGSRGERGHLVSLMGKVYRRASRVVIWLGSLQTFPHKLIRRIRLIEWLRKNSDIHEIHHLFYLLELKKSKTRASNLLAKMISLYVFNESNEDSFGSAAEEILGNPWFSRVWTLQEGLLPDRERCVIMSDSGYFNYPIMVDFLSDLYFSGIGTDHDILARTHERWRRLVSSGQIMAEETILGVLHPSMGLLSATVPQDRIYGFYGILGFLGVDLPEPDYFMDELEISELTTLAIIKSFRSLDVLQCCIRFDDSARRPSWILGSSTDTPTWLVDEYYLASRHSKGFSASRGHAVLSQKRGFGRLTVRGIIIGKIEFTRTSSVIGSLDTHFSQDITPFYSYIGACRSWCRHVAQRNSTLSREDLAEAIMRVLLYGRVLEDDNDSTTVDPFSTALEWLDLLFFPDCYSVDPIVIRNLSEKASPHISTPNLGNAATDAVDDTFNSVIIARVILVLICSHNKGYETARQILGHFMRLRNFVLMVLDTGHLASGLYVCKEGDTVALLAGCSQPMALRHVEGNEYRVVASLYVDGIMEGEAWPEEVSDLEEIILV